MNTARSLGCLALLAVLSGGCGEAPAPGGASSQAVPGGASPAQQAPSDEAPPLSEEERARLGAAQQALLAGLPEQVHGLLGGLLEREPVPGDVQFVAGSAAYELHRYGEAVARLSDAVRKEPVYLPNSSALGFAHLKLGDFDAARTAFERIVEVAPGKHKAHYGLGLVALSLGRLPEARASLGESLRLSPDYLKALYAMARLLDEEGRSEEALATVTIVCERWPSHDEALYLRGRLLASLGREQEAAEAFERHEAVYSVKESLAGLGARLGTDADGPALRLQMMELFLRIGDVAEAARVLSAALRLYPDDPDLARARQQLNDRR